MATSYTMNEKEAEAAKRFWEKHRCARGAKRVQSVMFTETGIGMNIVARCDGCGKAKDVSDYDHW